MSEHSPYSMPILSLNRLRKSYFQAFGNLMHHYSLTQTELRILLFLEAMPEQNRAADISSELGISKSNVSSALHALEERGTITRQIDPKSRRNLRLSFTEKGKEAAVQAAKVQTRIFEKALRDVDFGRVDQTIAKIASNLETNDLGSE